MTLNQNAQRRIIGLGKGFLADMNLQNRKIIIFIVASIGAFLLYLWFVIFGLDMLYGGTVGRILNQGKFNQETPGTTSQEIENKYGKPLDQESRTGTDVLFYNSSEKDLYDYVWTKDGK